MLNVTKMAGVLALGLLVGLAGCAKESAEGTDVAGHSEHDGHDHSGHDHDHAGEDQPAPSPELKAIVLDTGAPTQVVGVSQARSSTPDGEEVTVEGRLKDFVAGKAAFTIVDGSLKSCLEEGDECPTPWDYCCTAPNEVAAKSATVKLIDAEGKVLNGNLKGVNSIDNLSTVVVTGKVEKDATGNMTIAANKVYLK